MAFRTNKTPVLQEKTASGSVASFNTALPMPLASCNIAVNAWQEGSGDPSPSNVRNIVGVSEVGIQQTGGNCWDEEWELGVIDIQTGNKVPSSTRIRTKNHIPVLPNTTYYKVSPANGFRWIIWYDADKHYSGYINTTANGSFTTPANAYYMKSYTESNDYGTTYKNNISINVGTTDTTYHHYISNTVTLIDLDGTRYGGYVDVVGKKLVVTHAEFVFKGTETWSYSSQYASIVISSMKPSNFDQTGKANWLKAISSILENGIGFGSGGNKVIYVTQYVMADIGVSDITGWKNYLQDHNLEVVYPLATPIEIDLSDIPILSTIIGNNSFASDSGDISLTYNDLDIAKRGSFREVFKLP